MPVGLIIKVAVTSKTRSEERGRQTSTITETWETLTNLDDYDSDIESMLTGVDDYAITQRSNVLTEVSSHYSINLENVTAASPSKGSLLQAKGYFDGALSTDEMLDIDILRTTLLQRVTAVRTLAKY